ncbi:MAG TPA: hypothetical protein VIL95_05970, partial [Bacillota bacterium]
IKQREDEASQLILTHLAGRIGGRLEATPDAVAAVQAVNAGDVAAAAQRLRLDTVYFLHP